jgi:hypothetical protein
MNLRMALHRSCHGRRNIDETHLLGRSGLIVLSDTLMCRKPTNHLLRPRSMFCWNDKRKGYVTETLGTI